MERKSQRTIAQHPNKNRQVRKAQKTKQKQIKKAKKPNLKNPKKQQSEEGEETHLNQGNVELPTNGCNPSPARRLPNLLTDLGSGQPFVLPRLVETFHLRNNLALSMTINNWHLVLCLLPL
jgi:hypothetical protein